MYFSIKYRYSDIFLKNITSFCCNDTCYCVFIVSVTSASRYVTPTSRYQSRSSMYIRGLIPRNYTELAETVTIDIKTCPFQKLSGPCLTYENLQIIVNSRKTWPPWEGAGFSKSKSTGMISFCFSFQIFGLLLSKPYV